MNLFALNGAVINGSSALPLVQAEAHIVCSASMAADATRTCFGQAASAGSAALTAQPTRTTYGDALFAGESQVYPGITHQQAASAAIKASADITAFVVRIVNAEAHILGTATMSVIPAAALGRADIAAGAELTVDATRVTFASAVMGGTCGIDAAGIVTRYVHADITGQCAFKAEASYNAIQDGAANFAGAGSLAAADSGIVQSMAVATMVCQAETTAQATQILYGRADFAGESRFDTDGFVIRDGAAAFAGTSSVSPDATRVVEASASIVAACILQAKPGQRHRVTASIQGKVAIDAKSTRYVLPKAYLGGSADIYSLPQIDLRGFAAFGGSAAMTADAWTNAESLDPPERTFVRPFVETEFRRPFVETEFRRAA